MQRPMKYVIAVLWAHIVSRSVLSAPDAVGGGTAKGILIPKRLAATRISPPMAHRQPQLAVPQR